MIVLRKKRLVILSLFCCLTVFTMMMINYSAQSIKKQYNENKDNIEDIEKTLETVSLPNTNKVIVLDAGHGKPDERS